MNQQNHCEWNGIAMLTEYLPRPASPEEAGLFYAMTLEKDAALGCIGHVRMDFGRRGKEFWHTWWPRGPEELNSTAFKEELSEVVNALRETVLKDLASMQHYCFEHGGEMRPLHAEPRIYRGDGELPLLPSLQSHSRRLPSISDVL